jgi:hypothetical protein
LSLNSIEVKEATTEEEMEEKLEGSVNGFNFDTIPIIIELDVANSTAFLDGVGEMYCCPNSFHVTTMRNFLLRTWGITIVGSELVTIMAQQDGEGTVSRSRVFRIRVALSQTSHVVPIVC